MDILTVTQLIPVLQVAIGPVVLISGIGLLILSMTNRFGRVIDRGRSLTRELPEVPRQDQIRVNEQLRILPGARSICGAPSRPRSSASCWRRF